MIGSVYPRARQASATRLRTSAISAGDRTRATTRARPRRSYAGDPAPSPTRAKRRPCIVLLPAYSALCRARHKADYKMLDEWLASEMVKQGFVKPAATPAGQTVASAGDVDGNPNAQEPS